MASTGDTAATRPSRASAREPHLRPSRVDRTLPQVHRIEEIFCAALDAQPAELAAFLERACAGDLALRQEVEALLGAQREHTPDVLRTRALAIPELDHDLERPPPALPAHGAAPERDRVIAGYRLVAELGKGGMGEVHLGVHELTGERAAIKTMRADQADHGDAIARFLAEATAASRIDHPGIVRVRAHGRSAAGRAYIAMEYLEGESLRERLQRQGRLPIATAVTIARQVAAALAAAHAKGIIHRDLTPGNIFLTTGARGPDHVKILDFGVAKIMDAPIDGCCATPIGTILGTPTYMSPEQCQGAPHVDHRTDLYALGCVLFAMLCGRPPFTSKRLGPLLAAHLSQPPPRPSSLRPAVPAWLDQVVLRLLAKARDQRYARATDFLDALSGNTADACPDAGEQHGRPATAHELSHTIAQSQARQAAAARCNTSSMTMPARAATRPSRDDGETVRARPARRGRQARIPQTSPGAARDLLVH